MNKSDFHFELPETLIAQQPLASRDQSRLLVMDRATGALQDQIFGQLLDHLRDDDLLIFNNTRVIKARLFGRKPTGGKVEIMIERLLNDTDASAQLRSNHAPKPGVRLLVGDHSLEVLDREGGFFTLRSLDTGLTDLLDEHGHMPLPPYIRREDVAQDLERYQTVFADRPGAVAAPTAGLHFSEALLAEIDRRGIERGMVTLHVGAGTFQPMRVERIDVHRMHAERVEVGQQVCDQINTAREAGRRVIAVGTTSLRSLETAWQGNAIAPFSGESTIFIYPGIEVRSIDGLITNFHLPESTLIMLVSAFAGTEATLAAYRHAVAEQYRFFSYGDAMLIV